MGFQDDFARNLQDQRSGEDMEVSLEQGSGEPPSHEDILNQDQDDEPRASPTPHLRRPAIMARGGGGAPWPDA